MPVTAAVAVCLGFFVWSIALAVNDLRHRRLPDALTVPPAVAALAACVAEPALAWGLAWPGLYFAVGRGVGGGDIKLAISLGVVCASVAGAGGVIAAIGLAGLFSGIGAAVSQQRTVAHGPSMLCAAWAVCIASFLVLCMYSGV